MTRQRLAGSCRPISVAALGAAALFAVCSGVPVPVADPTIWPAELRIRGSVLVLGVDAPQDAALLRFVELAGGQQSRIVQLNAATARPDQIQGLDEATGVWLTMTSTEDGAQRDAGMIDERLVAALEEVVERGGVVAAVDRAGVDVAEATLGPTGTILTEGMRLIPGAVLQSSFRVGLDRRRLISALEGSPGLFGIGLPANAALELSGRRLRALAGDVVLMIPGGNERPVREEVLRAGAAGRANEADLTAWRRDAIERTLPPFPGPNPAPPNVAKGTLIIIGGGEVPEVVNEAFIEAAGGSRARLVFVPPEEADELPAVPGILGDWRAAGVQDAAFIHTKDRADADTARAILDPLADATGVFFGGGRQWNFSDSYYGTTAHRLMREVLDGGGVIAGTSAGASVQAEYMARGDPLGNQNIIAPGYERGLGFITGVAVDQHFTQRNRRPNMDELMAAYPELLGIGIDESTAIVVRGSVAEVIGNGRVFIFDRRTNPQAEPAVLSSGAAYDLRARRVIREARAQPER
jgi:cyanophycinase